MLPKVSVIIPCYNYDKYIEQCLMSVLLQRLNYNIEIIISDDNSTDNSFIVANRIKKFYETDQFKFIVSKNENNLGEINNTKSLLEKAKGEFIAYLDADDYWTDPYKLAKQIEFMEQNPDYSLCITGHMILENNQYIPVSDFNYWLCPRNMHNLTSEELSNSNCVGSSSSRFFRNYGNLIQDYFYDFPYSDWAINFELSLRGKVGYLDFPTYVYRVHDKSLSKKEIDDEKDNKQELLIKRVGILKEILNKKTLQ